MKLGRLGVWSANDRLTPAELIRLLHVSEDLGYCALWYPEAVGYEALSSASFMLANSKKLLIGSSIASIYARDAFTARRGRLSGSEKPAPCEPPAFCRTLRALCSRPRHASSSNSCRHLASR